jgi:hypothetical protein
VVAIHSDSPHCIEDGEVHTAVNSLGDEPDGSSAAAIAGVLFLSASTRISDRRNVWWLEAPVAEWFLSGDLVGRLKGVSRWNRL